MTDNIVELNDDSFDKTVNESDKLIIVEFYTTTCPNCAAIAPVYSKMSQELEKEAVFARINVEVNTKVATRFGIMGVPTFKFFCKNQPIGGIVGSINATMLRNTIKDYVRHRLECVNKSTPIVFEMDGYG
jgi:thioredoxin-like negative regulator of GroEL